MITTDPFTTPSERTRLVRTVWFGDDIIETPAPGLWRIGAGQPAVIQRRNGRHRRGEGHTICGAMMIGDQLSTSTLDFAMRGWTSHHADSTLHFAGRFESVDGAGLWHFRGRFASDTIVVDDATVQVGYRGVYHHGAHPVAWLTIHARVELPRRIGLWRSHIEWLADLNATAPTDDV